MSNVGLQGRLYEIEGSFNVRDLGGYLIPDGRTVRQKRFIRAGSLSSLTPKGRQALLDLGVQCIIDLRSQYEVSQRPDAVQDDDTFAWHHIPMLDYINSNMATATNFPESMEQMYAGLLAEAGQSFCNLFKIFADPRYSSYLFHCTAGKDRTGITSMLLLSLAGVPEEDIVEDYSHSESLLPSFSGAPGPSFLRSSAPETMRNVMNHLDRRYGGPLRYLSRIGVPEEHCAAVKSKLLD